MTGRRSAPIAIVLAFVAGVGCSDAAWSDRERATTLYALVQGIDGVFFYPPLGPEPTPAGTFDSSLLDGISVVIEAEDGDGVVTPLGRFDQATHPAVALLAERERYWVNIPAKDYVTDPGKTYRVRALLDGTELGVSVLSPKVFDVMAYNASLPIGVHLRVEGSGAVRAARRSTRSGGRLPPHCSDGVRNKDETGIDCGGSHCVSCEVCDGIDNDGDQLIDEDQPTPPCSTGLGGACDPGIEVCQDGRYKCVPTGLCFSSVSITVMQPHKPGPLDAYYTPTDLSYSAPQFELTSQQVSEGALERTPDAIHSTPAVIFIPSVQRGAVSEVIRAQRQDWEDYARHQLTAAEVIGSATRSWDELGGQLRRAYSATAVYPPSAPDDRAVTISDMVCGSPEIVDSGEQTDPRTITATWSTRCEVQRRTRDVFTRRWLSAEAGFRIRPFNVPLVSYVGAHVAYLSTVPMLSSPGAFIPDGAATPGWPSQELLRAFVGPLVPGGTSWVRRVDYGPYIVEENRSGSLISFDTNIEQIGYEGGPNLHITAEYSIGEYWPATTGIRSGNAPCDRVWIEYYDDIRHEIYYQVQGAYPSLTIATMTIRRL